MATKAITPAEARKRQPSTIPDVVFEVFNEILSSRAASRTITIKQDEVMDELMPRLPTIDRNQVFERNWLDIEPYYRKSGWQVEYDKPGYNESYGAYWTFTAKMGK